MSLQTSRSFCLRKLQAVREKHSEEERKMSSIPKTRTPWSSFNYTLCVDRKDAAFLFCVVFVPL